MKLEKKIIIKGIILAETGIMVGGNNSAFEIGGTDKQVVRNPINKRPYIPGSSLKGKMRSLLELSEGTIGEKYGPTLDAQNLAAQLFGHIKRRGVKNDSQQPSRIIVRDGELLNEHAFSETELLFTEVKAENAINRITAEANPRFFERVPKGAEFDLHIIINVFDEDNPKEDFLKVTYRALELVQDDYLGGGGSRGNGQVRFFINSVEGRTQAYYKEGQPAENLSHTIPPVFLKNQESSSD